MLFNPEKYKEKHLLHQHNISEHINSCWMRSGSLLLCFMCLFQHIPGKNFSVALAVKVSVQYLERITFQSSGFSGDYNVFNVFIRLSQVEQIGVHCKFLILASVTKILEEIVTEFQHSLLSILWKKESHNEWLLVLNFGLFQFKFVQCVSKVIEAFEHSTIYSRVRFIIGQVICYCVSSAIPYLITIRSIRLYYHCLSNCNGVWGLVALFSCIYKWLCRAVERFFGV